jgi:hypothetical protein
MVLRLAAAEVAGAYAEGKNHDEAGRYTRMTRWTGR